MSYIVSRQQTNYLVCKNDACGETFCSGESKARCPFCNSKTEENRNIKNLLSYSIDEPNYRTGLLRLTDQELIFCCNNETRKTGQKKLINECKKRGMTA